MEAVAILDLGSWCGVAFACDIGRKVANIAKFTHPRLATLVIGPLGWGTGKRGNGEFELVRLGRAPCTSLAGGR